MPEENKTDNFVMRTWLETVQSIAGENGMHLVLKKFAEDVQKISLPNQKHPVLK